MAAEPGLLEASGRAAVRQQMLDALAAIGLPLDTSAPGSTPERAPGGVHVTATVDGSGLVVAWRLAEDLTISPAEFRRRSDVLELLNLALGDVLVLLGWDAHPRHDGAEHLVVGRRPLAHLASDRPHRTLEATRA